MALSYDGVSGMASRSATLRASLRTLLMLMRGTATKPWLRSSTGPLFRGKAVTLLNAGFVSHTGRLVIEDYVELQGVSRRGITFGANVSIGRGTQVRPSSYYGGDAGEGLRMGNRSSIGADGFIGCSGWIDIGDDVMIGPGVRIFSENHNFQDMDAPIKDQGVSRGITTIEDDCWIASGVTITSGVRVGRGSVIAAGSVVVDDIPPYSVAAGIPARVIRSREDKT